MKTAIAAPKSKRTTSHSINVHLTNKQYEAVEEMAQIMRVSHEEVVKAGFFEYMLTSYDSRRALVASGVETLNSLDADEIVLDPEADDESGYCPCMVRED
jgi:hypothetical protein